MKKLFTSLLFTALLLVVLFTLWPSYCPLGNGTRAAVIITVPGDYSTIQSAIDAATDGDIIKVGAGVFREDIVINKAITLLGASNKDSIIEGTNEHAIRIAADGVTVSNFRIEHSGSFNTVALFDVKHTRITNNQISSNPRANMRAIFIDGGNDNIIEGNTIENSYGIAVSNNQGNVQGLTIKNNTIANNREIGIILFKYVNGVSIGDNLICNNTSFGIFCTAQSSDILIKGNIIKSNSDGISIGGSGLESIPKTATNITVENNTITENGCQGILVTSEESNNLTIRLNVISRNIENGLNLIGKDIVVTENIINNNGIGLRLQDTTYSKITGNIIAENIDTGLYLCNSSFNEIYSNDIQGNGIESGNPQTYAVDSSDNVCDEKFPLGINFSTPTASASVFRPSFSPAASTASPVVTETFGLPVPIHFIIAGVVLVTLITVLTVLKVAPKQRRKKNSKSK